MALFSSVSAEEIRAAQILTSVAMAMFVAVSVVPGLRSHAVRMRRMLLVLYLAACAAFVAYVTLR